MKALLYIVILNLLFGSYVNNKAEVKLSKGKAIVAGKVKNFDDSSKVLRFHAYGVVKDIEHIAVLDSVGNFRTEIELFNPLDIGLSYINSKATLFIHPGDSLYLNMDADFFKKDTYPYYDVSGNNSATSINIRDYLKSHTFYFFDSKFNPKFNNPFNEFLGDIKMYLAAEDSVLLEFKKQNKPTEEFIQWAKNNVLYNSFSLFINYYIINTTNNKEYITEVFDTNLFPCNDSSIANSIYVWYLSIYPIMKYSEVDTIAMQLLQKNEVQNSFARTFDNIFKNEKPGLSRDIMFYKIYNKLLDGIPGLLIGDGAALCEKYKSYICNPELISNLEEKLLAYNQQKNSNETIYDLKLQAKSEATAEFWEMLAKKHKDKIMYIDIWGTWCGACRVEIPSAVNLINYYKDEPFVFVTICSYSTKEEWEKVVPQFGQISDNYFFNQDESSYLQDELKISAYPKHMIINKKGELITKDIPNLSSKEIKNLFNKLINE